MPSDELHAVIFCLWGVRSSFFKEGKSDELFFLGEDFHFGSQCSFNKLRFFIIFFCLCTCAVDFCLSLPFSFLLLSL